MSHKTIVTLSDNGELKYQFVTEMSTVDAMKDSTVDEMVDSFFDHYENPTVNYHPYIETYDMYEIFVEMRLLGTSV